MARPLKDGVDYFPKDTDFYSNDKVKLLKVEFGAKGMFLLDYLLCYLYGKNGYFLNWNEDTCFLVSEGAGCGCDPKFIREFISGCFRRSFFDKGVFDTFGVITSPGIQRRYIRMFNSRESISIIKEYWLLDVNDRQDVPASVLKKLAFKSVKSTGNLDKSTGNLDESTGNAQREKEREKEIKVEESKGAAAPPAPSLTITRESLVQKYGEAQVNIYIAKTEKYHLTGANAILKAAEWLAADAESGKIKAKGTGRPTSFDLDEYGKAVDGFVPKYEKGSDTQ